jgi:hypothetical protein
VPLTDGLSVDGAPQAAAFLSGERGDPDAMALVVRAELADDFPVRTVRDLKGWVLRNLKVSESQLDRLVRAGDVTLLHRRIGGLEALELIRARGAASGRRTTRALALPGGDHVLILALVTLDGMDLAADTDWRYMVSSLQVDQPGTLASQSLLYGGFALGALVLLVVVMRWLGAVRRVRTCSRPWTPEARDDTHFTEFVAVTQPAPEQVVATRADSDMSVRPDVVFRQPDARPAVAEAAAPGGGLVPTLPPSGRWSQA